MTPAPDPRVPGKRGPKTPLGDQALLALIRADLTASPFRGEGHRRVFGRTYRNRTELATAVAAFVETYNCEWRLEKLRYQSPLEARRAYQSSKPLAA